MGIQQILLGSGATPDEFIVASAPITSDFERRKLAEQRATRRLSLIHI